MAKEMGKKPFYKKWWVWVVSVPTMAFAIWLFVAVLVEIARPVTEENVLAEAQESKEMLEESVGKLVETKDKLKAANDKLDDTEDTLKDTEGKLEEAETKVAMLEKQLGEANTKVDEVTAEDKAVPTKEVVPKKVTPPAQTSKNPILNLDPAEVASVIEANAKADWVDDFEMQDYQIENQTNAYNQLKAVVIDNDVKKTQIENAMSEWGMDFEMIQYQYDNQMEAYNN